MIEEGYLAEENPDGNDNEKITDPLGGYLDCQNINITREDDSYKIEVIDSISCSTSGLVNTSKILVDVYEYRDNQVGNKLGTNGNVDWTNSDKVVLMANVSNVSGVLNDSIWAHGTSTTNKRGKIAYSVNEINAKILKDDITKALKNTNLGYLADISSSDGINALEDTMVTYEYDSECKLLSKIKLSILVNDNKKINITYTLVYNV